MGPGSLILLIACGIAFAGGGIVLSNILARHSKNAQKGQTYECGIPTIGKSWIQFNVGYYLFALLFLLFDVEVVFLYPWAVVYKELLKTHANLIFGSMISFLAILLVGYLYAVKKRAFDWKS